MSILATVTFCRSGPSRTHTGMVYVCVLLPETELLQCCSVVIKLIICPCIVYLESGSCSAFFGALTKHMTLYEVLKLSVPSLIYAVQNNLLYFALTRLDAATFQVCYQLKLLTTAVFSVIFLGRRLSAIQWLSLVVLAAGVSLSQLSPDRKNDVNDITIDEQALGFVSVVMAAVLSGFAGVYFEKIIKGSDTSLWIRNVQLTCTSVILSVASIFLSGDWLSVRERGFLYGYTEVVWSVVFLQAVGGLLVALAVKYADNILKGFAASLSIVTSALLSFVLFADFSLNRFLMGGIVCVTVAIYLFSRYPPPHSVPVSTTKDREQDDKMSSVPSNSPAPSGIPTCGTPILSLIPSRPSSRPLTASPASAEISNASTAKDSPSVSSGTSMKALTPRARHSAGWMFLDVAEA